MKLRLERRIENMEEDKPFDGVNLELLREAHPMLKALVDSNYITEQGSPRLGGGVEIKLLKEIKALLDKNNMRLNFIEKRLEEIRDK